MLEIPFVDVHSHRKIPQHVIGLFSLVCKDFIPAQPPENYYSVGLHPWFISRQNVNAALQKIDTAIHDNNLLAIGECGLDRLTDTAFAQQEAVFIEQINRANQSNKPIIIHCVRAFNELLAIKKRTNAVTPWVVHGFNSNSVITDQLIHQNCYLSLGKALMNEHSNARKALLQAPIERIFLETDEAELTIDQLYQTASELLKLPLELLKCRLFENFQRVFLHG